jgi:hypothetical protein
MAASYDPDPTAPFGVRLPVDARLTCEVDRRALAALAGLGPDCGWWTPAPTTLRTLRGLYLDCGRRDQYNLDLRRAAACTARSTASAWRTATTSSTTITLAIDYRMDESLPFLARALA